MDREMQIIDMMKSMADTIETLLANQKLIASRVTDLEVKARGGL